MKSHNSLRLQRLLKNQNKVTNEFNQFLTWLEQPDEPSLSPTASSDTNIKIKKPKKKEGLSDDLVKDIIYGMNEVVCSYIWFQDRN